MILAALISSAEANVIPPKAYISEIFFNSSGNWTIELGFLNYSTADIDSIIIETSAGSSKVNFYTLIQGGGYPNFDSLAVISDINLNTPLMIDPLNDYIKVISYILGFSFTDYVALGNYPGSFVDCRQSGESISYLVYLTGTDLRRSFCVDKSPSIGSGNDTTGALSNYAGYVYDLPGNVFTQGFFALPPGLGITININPDGSFVDRVFARRYTFDTIRIYFPPWLYIFQTFTVEHVDFCLKPDTLQIQNIITTSLVTAVDKHEPENNVVVISPNPFTNKVSFYFNLDNQNPAEDMSLSIYNQDGRRLKQIKLTTQENKIEWIPDEFIPSGALIYHLMKNGQVIKSGKLLKL